MHYIALTQTVKVKGIPLASPDLTSVVVAYARGVFGALMLVGFLAIMPLISLLTGERLDEFGMLAMRVLLACFAAGIAGGIVTYALPLTPRREREIRRYCGELVGVALDPARLEIDASARLGARVDERYESADDPRVQLIRTLIATRVTIAQAIDANRIDSDHGEMTTDELLEQLGHLDRTAA